MPRRQPKPEERVFKDETAQTGPGDVRYILDLTDDEVEAMAAGHLPERVREACWGMTGWKRPAAEDPLFTKGLKRPR